MSTSLKNDGQSPLESKPLVTENEWDDIPAAKPKGKALWAIGLMLLTFIYLGMGSDDAKMQMRVMSFAPDKGEAVEQTYSYGFSKLIAEELSNLTDQEIGHSPNFSEKVLEDIPHLLGHYSADGKITLTLFGGDGMLLWQSKPMDGRNHASGLVRNALVNIALYMDTPLDNDQRKALDALTSYDDQTWFLYPKAYGYLRDLGTIRNSDRAQMKDIFIAMHKSMPKFIQGYWLEGRIMEQIGDKTAAKGAYMRAIQLDPLRAQIVPEWVLYQSGS